MTTAATMTSRERVIRTLNHEPVDRVPRDLRVAPAVEALRGDEVAELSFRYPADILRADARPHKGPRTRGNPAEPGEHTDAWGCVWQVPERHGTGRLKLSPLADLGQLAGYRLPWELVEKPSFAAVNRAAAATSRFVLGWTEVRPLERLGFLHGPQDTHRELALGTRPIRDLLDMVHDVFCREIETWAASDVDGVVFQDGWGPGSLLPIPPRAWRELLRPLYREYCEILHARDKFAFFRCEGSVEEVFEDLVQAGIDAIEAEVASLDLQRLADRYRGRITFWGAAEHRELLASGTAEEIRAAVHRLGSAVDFGRGGVIAQAEWTPAVSFDSVAAFFEQWLAPLPMDGRT